MKKLTPVANRPIDGRIPHMSISSKTYREGFAKLREQAKREKKKLITENGVEDYTNIRTNMRKHS